MCISNPFRLCLLHSHFRISKSCICHSYELPGVYQLFPFWTQLLKYNLKSFQLPHSEDAGQTWHRRSFSGASSSLATIRPAPSPNEHPQGGMSRCFIPSRLPSALFALTLLGLSAEQRSHQPARGGAQHQRPQPQGTYFSAGKPRWSCCSTVNRQRKVRDDLAGALPRVSTPIRWTSAGDSSGTLVDKLTPRKSGGLRDKMPTDSRPPTNTVSQPATKDTIAVGGASCGVNQSVHVAANHPEVKALVSCSLKEPTQAPAISSHFRENALVHGRCGR